MPEPLNHLDIFKKVAKDELGLDVEKSEYIVANQYGDVEVEFNEAIEQDGIITIKVTFRVTRDGMKPEEFDSG